MNTCLLGLLAETSIHPGAANPLELWICLLPVRPLLIIPLFPGSSLKRRVARPCATTRVKRAGTHERTGPQPHFGRSDNAGALLVSDARLLLLPVRSLSSAYKWVTCPHLLERFSRDQQRADKNAVKFELTTVEAGKYLGVPAGTLFSKNVSLSTRANCRAV